MLLTVGADMAALDLLAYPFGHGVCVGIVGIGQHDTEFIAAESAGSVHFAQIFIQHTGHFS